METLRLELDSLAVESFPTQAQAAPADAHRITGTRPICVLTPYCTTRADDL